MIIGWHRFDAASIEDNFVVANLFSSSAKDTSRYTHYSRGNLFDMLPNLIRPPHLMSIAPPFEIVLHDTFLPSGRLTVTHQASG